MRSLPAWILCVLGPLLAASQLSAQTGSISASPNPCQIAAGKKTCRTTLSWSGTGTSGLLVRVSHNGRASTVVSSSGRRGSTSPSWIQAAPSHTYTFYLYNYAGRVQGKLLDSVKVTGKAPAKPKAPTIRFFSARPSSIDKGKSSTLRWSTSNATSVSISPGIGKVKPQGYRRVSPSKTTTYTLTATNSTKSVKATAKVTVRPVSAPTATISASPTTIDKGKSSTLRWSTSNATSVSISPGIGKVSAGGSRKVSPSKTTTYVLTATNSIKSIKVSAKVTVRPPPSTVSGTISASPNPCQIAVGKRTCTTTLTWRATGTSGLLVRVSRNGRASTVLSSSGRSGRASPSWIQAAPANTYTFSLYNYAGRVQGKLLDSVKVTGRAPVKLPKISSFKATPASIEKGEFSTLSWRVTNADTLSISPKIGKVTGTSIKVSPSLVTTYTLTATNAAGSVKASTTVTVGVSLAPKISSFTASPATINPGGRATLRWSVTNADTLSIDQGIGTLTDAQRRLYARTGLRVSPSVTTLYTLTATNSFKSVTATVTVTVRGSPKISRFRASPVIIDPGKSSTLSWSTTGADSLSISPGVGTVKGTSVKVSPSATTLYTLTATNAIGSVKARATVQVRGPPKISRFRASPKTIASGGRSTLSWSVTGADSLSISPGVGTVKGTSVKVSPSATTTYTLTATNAIGSSRATATVTIRPLPKIISFTVSPSTINSRGRTTLRWRVTNADRVFIDQGIGTVTGTSYSVSPSVTTTYKLTATNLVGLATATVTVTVRGSPKIISFTANPARIDKGKSSTLKWRVTNADSLSISPGVGKVTGTSVKVSPSLVTTYTLKATNSVGSVTARATVTVGVSLAPRIDSFTANPARIDKGKSSTLSWSVTNADRLSIDQNIDKVSASGSRKVSPSVTTTYTLTAANSIGSATARATVTVKDPSGASGTISASPNPCTINPSLGTCDTTISWTIKNTSSARVYYSLNGAKEKYFIRVRGKGSRLAPFIKGPPNKYVFSLYDYSDGRLGDLLASVTVTGQAASTATGSISVSPDPCTIYHGQTGCTPTVSWQSKGATEVQVWYSLNGGEEKHLASSAAGPHSRKLDVALKAGDRLVLKLYDYSSGTRQPLAKPVEKTLTVQEDIGCPPASN